MHNPEKEEFRVKRRVNFRDIPVTLMCYFILVNTVAMKCLHFFRDCK